MYASATFWDYEPCVCIYFKSFLFFPIFPPANHHIKVRSIFLFPQCSIHTMFTHFHPRPFVLLTFSSSPFFIFSFSFFNFLFSHHNSPDFPTFLSSYQFKVSVYFFQLLLSLANINHLKLSFFVADLVLSFILLKFSFVFLSQSHLFPKKYPKISPSLKG